LKPKKSKDLIPEVAKQTELSEHLVKEITDFYWQEVRKSLSSLKHACVHITNLGDFTIKHWKIDDKITNLEKFEESNKQKGLQQMTARFKTAETLFDLKAVKKLLDEEKQRKDFIKLHKTKSNESKKEHNQDMESQGSDPGGSD
jgi:nucleoid DNA-binding protein